MPRFEGIETRVKPLKILWHAVWSEEMPRFEGIETPPELQPRWLQLQV